MAFTQTEPFLALGGKIDPLTEIRNAGIVTSGNVYWVKAATDSAYTTLKDQVGASSFRDTIQDANTIVTADRNDYILVAPQDANAIWAPNGTAGTALVLSKARTHVLSLGYTNSPVGYSNTIRGYGSSVANDTSLIKIQAPGIEMAGFRVLGTSGTNANGTLSGALVSVGTAASGTAHSLWLHHMGIEGNNATGGAAGTTTMINHVEGDGLRIEDSVVGNLAYHANSISLSASALRPEFRNVRFMTSAQATGDKFIVANSSAPGYALFERCQFINVNTGTAVASVVTGSITVANPFLLSYCTYVGVTQAGTDPTVYKAPTESGTATSLRDLGIAVGTAALAPS